MIWFAFLSPSTIAWQASTRTRDGLGLGTSFISMDVTEKQRDKAVEGYALVVQGAEGRGGTHENAHPHNEGSAHVLHTALPNTCLPSTPGMFSCGTWLMQGSCRALRQGYDGGAPGKTQRERKRAGASWWRGWCDGLGVGNVSETSKRDDGTVEIFEFSLVAPSTHPSHNMQTALALQLVHHLAAALTLLAFIPVRGYTPPAASMTLNGGGLRASFSFTR